MFLFYSFHYPYAEKEEAFVQAMRHFDKVMEQQSGIVFVAPYPFKDPEKGALMGISLWESQEAFQAALPALLNARKDDPSHGWEAKPPEVYMLNSADCTNPVFAKWR